MKQYDMLPLFAYYDLMNWKDYGIMVWYENRIGEVKKNGGRYERYRVQSVNDRR